MQLVYSLPLPFGRGRISEEDQRVAWPTKRKLQEHIDVNDRAKDDANISLKEESKEIRESWQLRENQTLQEVEGVLGALHFVLAPIFYMEKILQGDWLGEMQFSGNTREVTTWKRGSKPIILSEQLNNLVSII